MRYIWEQPEWPKFRWDEPRLAQPLADLRHEQGRLLGRMESLGFALRQEAFLRTLTRDALKTSEIEGEKLDAAQVRSSLARRLGIDIGALTPADRNVEGVVEMTLDATRNFADPLTEDRLLGWHSALFPTGRTGRTKIRVGVWRDDAGGPMQVVSGPVGRERIHYSAPPAEGLAAEMGSFLAWFNGSPAIDPVIKAALAHLWFVTIHPFDDGNGRVARAIADLALARSEQSTQRFYSMAAQIQAERRAYYAALERTQHDTLDVTRWMAWFLGCLHRAIDGAEGTLSAVLAKAHFWRRYASAQLNGRQIKVLNQLLDGFEGKLTSSKWAKIGKCSQDTAIRDIVALVEMQILTKDPAGGRSTSYALASPGDS
jgi:Fic family protein